MAKIICYGEEARHALERGVKWTGATVSAPPESGEVGHILLQEPVRVLEGDGPEDLRRRIIETAGPMLVEAVKAQAK